MKELHTVLEALRKLPSVEFIREVDTDYYNVEINCGRLPSGIAYEGYYGAGVTQGNELRVAFSIGDEYGDGEMFSVSPLSTRVVSDSTGMPYSSNLEAVISDMLSSATNGLFSCSGSEQGMQDYDEYDNGTVTHYFSADVELQLESVAA